MCGICGIRRLKGGQPIDVWQLEQLLLDNQKRGLDATGVAVQYEDGKIQVYKNSDTATQFVAGHRWKEWKEQHWDEERIVTAIGHTRAWTKGVPSKNENNHPVVDGSTVAIHNGGIWNDDYLFGEEKMVRHAEVDSQIIPAILEKYGLTPEGVKALNRMSGHAAIAAMSSRYPGRLLLARSGSPLVLGWWRETGQLVFSSRKEGIHNASRAWIYKWGIPFKSNRADLVFNPVEWNQAYLFGPEQEEGGCFWHGEFNSAGSAEHRVVYRCHETFWDKKKKAREEENKEVVETALKMLPAARIVPSGVGRIKGIRCKNKTCGAMNSLTVRDQDVPLWMQQCGKCSTRLGEMPRGEA